MNIYEITFHLDDGASLTCLEEAASDREALSSIPGLQHITL